MDNDAIVDAASTVGFPALATFYWKPCAARGTVQLGAHSNLWFAKSLFTHPSTIL